MPDTLRSKVIRLAASDPTLRPRLLRILALRESEEDLSEGRPTSGLPGDAAGKDVDTVKGDRTAARPDPEVEGIVDDLLYLWERGRRPATQLSDPGGWHDPDDLEQALRDRFVARVYDASVPRRKQEYGGADPSFSKWSDNLRVDVRWSERVESPDGDIAGGWDIAVTERSRLASLDRDTLDQLVEMDAESLDLDASGARATPEVLRAADAFKRALVRSLSSWAERYPPKDGYTVADLVAAEGPYLVYMTLEGHGVGIWDGRWDAFYDDTSKLEQFLRQTMRREHAALKNAITEAAFDTAAPDEE